MTQSDFDLALFIPYLLNRAAEKTSHEFETVYKSRYGMLRMEWRVLFHLGRYGAMTAKEICIKGGLHKTKVSRAVAALESKRFLNRTEHFQDRRYETLALSALGKSVYDDLSFKAAEFNSNIVKTLPDEDEERLISVLQALISSK